MSDRGRGCGATARRLCSNPAVRRWGFAFAALICAGLITAMPAGAATKRHPKPVAKAAPAGPTLPLGHSGRWITDAGGRVVILHGTNMVDKLAPYYPAAAGFGPADAAFLKSIGFNAVRVGVLWQGLEPEPGVFNPFYLDEIKATVTMLAKAAIVSLLDFHQDLVNQEFGGEGWPSWAVQTGGLPNPDLSFDYDQEVNPALQNAYDAFYANAAGPNGIGLQDYYTAAWEDTAAKFRGDSSVLGYEIMNEPWPGTLWETCLTTLGCPGVDRELTTFYNRVVQSIRSTDKRTLIFYEPASLFNDGVNTTIGGIDSSNIGFAFHDYCLVGGTNPVCDTQNSLVFDHALARVKTTGQALLETEFGASDDTAYLRGLVSDADTDMVPWLEWAYCACGDPTTVDSSEGIVDNPAKPLTGSNLITPTLEGLVEPYPQVISGTPLHYAYNSSSHAFSFAYSTARAGSQSVFPARSVTQIATPAMAYPHGYQVMIQGGSAVSKANASELLVASSPGVSTIDVSLTPR